ncbi:DUF1934 family protein [Cohnella sp. CFH 77786]|uniref:DUF1934 domain-containing protein n=1 Tax=Cohnella sp. CFH 77786 TaxID=2662265 RepID=UPI001C608A92|nr:DUF1934 domain-containing protein [Cohnella sp. CFH 77786]MBW5448692.1 DUF1934 family protein [Cohnella sp. CFH 77786]
MPDKVNVRVAFRIVRDGETQEIDAPGRLHRLVDGWAVTCRMAGTSEGTEPTGESDMTLLVRDGEIRMSRRGTVSQDQAFRVGEWRSGTVGTAYGSMAAEAWTHRMETGLSKTGGTVEWEYDMRMAGQELGRCSIRLDIREEQI